MVKDLIKDKEIFKTGMRGEEERCREALELSKDKKSCFNKYWRFRNLWYGWTYLRDEKR